MNNALAKSIETSQVPGIFLTTLVWYVSMMRSVKIFTIRVYMVGFWKLEPDNQLPA